MTLATEWNSSAFDAEYAQPAVLGGHATASTNHAERRDIKSWDRVILDWLRGSPNIGGRTDASFSIDAGRRIVPGGSSTVFTHEVLAEHSFVQAKFRAYEDRIRELCGYAAEDGYDLNMMSYRDFWRFVRTEPEIRRGNLILGDNGNLHAVWRDGNGTHLGLQFLGAGVVQYVIFKKRKAASVVSRVAGRDTFDGLRRQIDAFDLRSLLYQ